MLQPRVQNQPSIGPEVGTPVPADDGHGTIFVHGVAESAQCGNGGDRRGDNFTAQLFGEHGRVGAEVVGNLAIQRSSVLGQTSSGGQTKQVQRPAEEQMRPDLESGKGAVAHGLVPGSIEGVAFKVFAQTIVFRRRRNVRFTVHQVIGASVVFGMGVLPSEIGYQQGLVDNESNKVIVGLRRRESTVSTFMSNDPRSSPDGSLPKGIERPTKDKLDELDWIRRNFSRKNNAGTVGKGSRDGQVPSQVEDPPDVRPIEALLRN